MAKKKTTKKEVNEENDFDFESYLTGLVIPEMLKEGFRYHIITNNISIKSENDLNKELTKFKQI